ncbi:MAG: hypothetical protein IPL32_04650 [Chloracidobacterium sp.]|nr:hypothetical protein [Chloracidobacterium sp.]
MWKSRTKIDLIIEVWEKLDCENVGAAEIKAIQTVVADQYGTSAVDSPMVIARLLADEGAQLRHSEIMNLYLERASDRPYDAAVRNIIKIDDLKSTAASIRNLENLRQKYAGENDKDGLRLVRETALGGKQAAAKNVEKKGLDDAARQMNAEIVQWFTVWLQTPEVFESWHVLRQRSPEFIDKFGDIRES